MTTNLLELSQHKIYLQSRIALLVQKHADYKTKEDETPESDHKLALNSSAACIWDAKCEMEAALDNLEKVRKATYPFTPLSCTLYEYSGPCMKIQLPDGTKVDISLPDGNHGSFFEQLDKLLTTGTSMVLGYNAEYRNSADKKKGTTFQMHYPEEGTDVFDLLANATRPQTVHSEEETRELYHSTFPRTWPDPYVIPSPNFADKIDPTSEDAKDIDEAEYKSDYPFRWSMGIKPHKAAAFQEMMNTPTDVSKAIVEPAKHSFIVEPDESNSNIGHDD
jgi:hypothetical protein